MRFVTALIPTLALVLSACGSGQPAAEPDPSGSATPSAEPPASATSPTGLTSRYTDFDLAKCKILAENREEGSSADYSCPGLDGVPILVQEGDGRFDLDAGVDDDGFQTISAFNDIGDKIEWRLRDGKPFAVIFRYRDVSMESSPRSVLTVEKIGWEGAPGCRVAQIGGSVPKANERARDIADTRAVDFDCSQEPEILGNAQ